MSPFDFINAINSTKQNLFLEDPQASKDYKPFLVNKGLSYFPDTILYANEMNQNTSIPVEWQFSFFLNSISKKKRFSKWVSKTTQTEDFLIVKEYFGYSDSKTQEALSVLSDDHLVMIKEKLYKGGK